eukprot:4698668-Amphidinium_carterae.1
MFASTFAILPAKQGHVPKVVGPAAYQKYPHSDFEQSQTNRTRRNDMTNQIIEVKFECFDMPPMEGEGATIACSFLQLCVKVFGSWLTGRPPCSLDLDDYSCEIHDPHRVCQKIERISDRSPQSIPAAASSPWGLKD